MNELHFHFFCWFLFVGLFNQRHTTFRAFAGFVGMHVAVFRHRAGVIKNLAAGLKHHGLRPGDRVALCMPMTADVVTILYACLKLGLIAVPIFAGFGAGFNWGALLARVA